MSESIISTGTAGSIAVARWDVGAETGPFDFGDAPLWQILVTWDGQACGYFRLAGPGPVADPGFTVLALDAHAAPAAQQRELEQRLRRRFGHPSGRPARRKTVTVAICTHRRPRHLARALAAVQALDPPADEVVVVDNDPGELDVRDLVEAAGARYVREDRLGLDRARRRALAAASGELLAFTDDDCEPARHWLSRLDAAFEDPTVGAVTGPAFARRLDTRARVTRERHLSFVLGLRSRRVDWTNTRPVVSGGVGAGANMILRRELLETLGDVFPADLGAGTPSSGGDDLYTLYRVLAAGRRVLYDPSCWVLHDHAPGTAELARTVHGYGRGFSAFLLKVLIEERALAAPLAWSWLPNRAVTAALGAHAWPDPGHPRLRIEQLRGSLEGARAWQRARRAAAAAPAPAPVQPRVAAASAVPDEVALVVTPDARRRTALASQATAPYLLFVDAPPRDPAALATAHLDAQRAAGGDALVAGVEHAPVAARGLAAQLAALRADDAAHASARSPVLSAAAVPSGNLSIGRERFVQLGGFAAAFTGRRATWDLALRAVADAVPLVCAPEAVTEALLPDGLGALVHAARRDGDERAALTARHPSLGATVDVRAGMLVRALRVSPRAARCARGAAALFEAARARRLWLRIARALERAAFLDGWARRAGGDPPPAIPVVVELTAEEAIPAPLAAAPPIEVRLRGRRVGGVAPVDGRWPADLPRSIADVLGEADWQALGTAGAPDVSGPEDRDVLALVPPGSATGDFSAPGVEAAVLEPGGSGCWPAIDGAVRAAAQPVVAVALPGVRVTPAWLEVARVPLRAERVALALGAGVPSGAVLSPMLLHSRAATANPYPILGRPSQFLVVDREAYLGVGGLDLKLRGGGAQAPLLDLVERLLDGGHVIAYQETPGIDPPGATRPARSEGEWERWRARGRLVAAAPRGSVVGILGGQLALLPSALRRHIQPSVRHLVGGTVAFLAGAAEGAARSALGR